MSQSFDSNNLVLHFLIVNYRTNQRQKLSVAVLGQKRPKY